MLILAANRPVPQQALPGSCSK